MQSFPIGRSGADQQTTTARVSPLLLCLAKALSRPLPRVAALLTELLGFCAAVDT